MLILNLTPYIEALRLLVTTKSYFQLKYTQPLRKIEELDEQLEHLKIQIQEEYLSEEAKSTDVIERALYNTLLLTVSQQKKTLNWLIEDLTDLLSQKNQLKQHLRCSDKLKRIHEAFRRLCVQLKIDHRTDQLLPIRPQLHALLRQAKEFLNIIVKTHSSEQEPLV